MLKAKKYVLPILAALAISAAASPAHAQQCGAGNIVDIKEGGWNSEDFMIKLSGPNASASTLWQGYVRFSVADLSATRIEAIRRLATTAFALNASVWTFSHNGSCASATEISILQ